MAAALRIPRASITNGRDVSGMQRGLQSCVWAHFSRMRFKTQPSPLAGAQGWLLASKLWGLCNLLRRGEEMGKRPCPVLSTPLCTATQRCRTPAGTGGTEPIPSTSKSEKSLLTFIFYPPHTGFVANSDSCTAHGPV